jgi:cobalamin-dependent methionine synthase I
VLLVADNIHGLNPVVADAMERLDPEPIRELAKRCEAAGADLIDINPGYLSKKREDRMEFLVDAVQEAASLGLVLDGADPRVLAVGLSACNEKPILNALSGEERKLREIPPLAVEKDTDLVILLMDERSFTPPSVEEKLALALELRGYAVDAGMSPDRLIFDPILPNLSWDDAFHRASQAVKTVRLLASGAVLQEPTRTMAGLSNLRSGLRDRFPWEVERSCMSLLAGAGLEYLLADVLRPEFRDTFEMLSRLC